jgi:RNA polymerase sigma factor (sigma-70 family)
MSPAAEKYDDEVVKLVAQLYERYSVVLLRRLVRKLPTRQDADDVCQEIFTTLLKRKEMQTVENWQYYLYSVANHAISRFYARRVSHAPIDDSLEALEEMRQVPSESGERDMSLQLLEADIKAAVQKMCPVHRLVALQCVFLGATTLETAQKLGLPVRTVERYRCSVMKQLSDALSGWGA